MSGDGRTLTFTSPVLGAGQRLEIRYVVEITAGARGKQLVNTAHALGPDGLASNAAQATIQLREELFRDRAIVMGRIVEGDCATAANQLSGVAGVRVYLEDGRYSITDDEGKYHFEDVAPGSHVVQVDEVTIPDTHEALSCPGRVRHAGRSYSQFVDLRGGALWRSDFVLARRTPPRGFVSLALQTRIEDSGRPEPGEGLSHSISVEVASVPLRNVRVLVMLPDGLAYQSGSARLDDLTTAEPASQSGVLTFTLGEASADAKPTLSFRTIASNGSSGALSVKAAALFDSPSQTAQRTAPVENVILRGEMLYESASYRFAPRFDVLTAEIQPTDRAQLEKIVSDWRGVKHLRLTAIGHSDRTVIAARSQSTYADNYALSRARAEAVAHYLIERLQIDPARVSVEGRGADEPLAQGHDAKSLALNRRVDIAIEGLRVVAAGGLSLKTAGARTAPTETVGVLEASGVAHETIARACRESRAAND